MAVTRSGGGVMEEVEEGEHVMWWRRRWGVHPPTSSWRIEAKEKSCSPDSSASSGGLTGAH